MIQIVAFVLLVLMGLWMAVEIGSGGVAGPAAVGGGIVLLALIGIFGRKRPIELVALVAGSVGFMICGKGFAYLRLGQVFFMGEMILAFVALFYIVRVYTGRFSLLPGSRMTLPLFLLLAYSGIHALYDYNTYGLMAFRDACIAYYAIVFFAAYQLGREPAAVEFTARVFVWAAPVVLMVAVINSFFPSLMRQFQNLTVRGVPLLIPHEAVTNACLGMVCALIIRARQVSFWSLVGLMFAIVSLGYLIVSARGAAMMSIFCCAAWLILARQWKVITIGVPIAIVAVIVMVPILSAYHAGSESDLWRKIAEQVDALNPFTFGSQKSVDAATGQWRVFWWKMIWNDTLDHAPLFGEGFGKDIYSDFHRAFFRTPYVSEDAARTRGAHNAFFTFIARGGLIAGLFFAWVIVVQVGYFWRAAGALRRGELPWHSLYLWGFLIVGFVVTFVQYTWEASYIAIPFWTCCGLAFAELDRIEEARDAEESSLRPAAAQARGEVVRGFGGTRGERPALA